MPEVFSVVGTCSVILDHVYVDMDFVGEVRTAQTVWLAATFHDEIEADGFAKELQLAAAHFLHCRQSLFADPVIEEDEKAFTQATQRILALDYNCLEYLPGHPDENGDSYSILYFVRRSPMKGFK